MNIEDNAQGGAQAAAQSALLKRDLPPLMADLVEHAVHCAYDDTAKSSQGTAAVLTLVLVKHGAALARLSRPGTTGK